ncbi:hypothetical protein OY671_007208 [Metschnikowia pulcherrima]|nr:hypothetical protein OY671_007208 [Metschnikowia pulcherrima]
MTTLSITARGQVTFRKEILKHLGIQPGGKIRLDLSPDGRAELKADRPKGSWRESHGMLKGKGNGPRFTIEEINDAIADAGAAAGMAVSADDDAQGLAALEPMENASLVAISVHSSCELAWVLERLYKKARSEIATAIRGVIEAENVVVNRPAVDAGLAVLDAGGDFADGVIAFDGQWLGGETFVSFDKTARDHEQARAITANWVEAPALIVTSPYTRTRQTAAPTIARFPDAPVKTAERMPHLERYWSAADPDYCDGEGAESFRALLRRCDAASARFAAIPPASSVYVFGMGSSSRPRARSSPTPL